MVAAEAYTNLGCTRCFQMEEGVKVVLKNVARGWGVGPLSVDWGLDRFWYI
jgi:hypothetical protein